MSDCDNNTFVSVSETFGGKKPVPSCMPGTTRVPDELHEASGLTTTAVDVPAVIIKLRNRVATAYCFDRAIWNDKNELIEPEGEASIVGDGIFNAQLPISADFDLSDSMLVYINTNDLADQLSTQYHTREITTAEQVASLLHITSEQADAILSEMNSLQSNLDAQAKDLAEMGLNCVWYNAKQIATCKPDRDGKPAATEMEVEGAVPHAVVPAHTVSSTVSYADANAQALAMATAMLNCIFASESVYVECQDKDRPGKPDNGGNEAVPNTDFGYGGRPPRVGTALVPSGKFTSIISVAEATRRAQEYGWTLLECYYVNDLVFEECGLPSARGKGIDPATNPPVEAKLYENNGQYIEIPHGTIISELSTLAATNEARDMALAALECCYINQRVEKHCKTFTYTTPEGKVVEVKAVDGDNMNETAVVEAGTLALCVNEYIDMYGGDTDITDPDLNTKVQEEVNRQADEMANTLLNCIYCNVAVIPKCVPGWVEAAVTDGILLSDTVADRMGVPHGTLYKISLPLDTNNIIDPATGEKVDTSTWSVDATVGVAEATFCGDNFTKVQPIADMTNSVRALPNGECRYANDLVVAGCSVKNPYVTEENNPDYIERPGQWRKMKKEDSTEPYYFYTKFNVDVGLSANAQPKENETIEVATGTFVYTTTQVPGTQPKYIVTQVVTDELIDNPDFEEGMDESVTPRQINKVEEQVIENPKYNEDYNAKIAKAYANNMAKEYALTMLDCFFENHLTEAACEWAPGHYREFTFYTEDPYIRQAEVWTNGLMKLFPEKMTKWSNTELNDNLSIVPAGMFKSYVSLMETYKMAINLALTNLVCQFCNDEQVCHEKNLCQSGCSYEPQWSRVEQCTIISDTITQANDKAQTLACNLAYASCRCAQPCVVCNVDEHWGNCNNNWAGTSGGGGGGKKEESEGEKPGKAKLMTMAEWIQYKYEYESEGELEIVNIMINQGYVGVCQIWSSKPICCVSTYAPTCPDTIAQNMADAMTVCMSSEVLLSGKKGDKGEPGEKGDPGSCAGGTCNGVYA